MNTMTVTYDYDTTIVTCDDEPSVRYVAMPDTDTDSPVHWGGFDVYVYRASYRSGTDHARSGERVESRAFFELMERFNDEEYVLPIVRRYMRIFHGVELGDSIATYSARGYSQSDWWDVLVICDDTGMDASACAHVWEQWARGDVWFVRAEYRTPCDSQECHGDDACHWSDISDQGIESLGLGGIYADDAEAAVTQYVSLA